MEDREKFEAERAETGDDVEGHKLEEADREKTEPGDDVEGHSFAEGDKLEEGV